MLNRFLFALLENIPQKYGTLRKPIFIDSGAESKIYQIGDNVVIKINQGMDVSGENLKKEFEIMSNLFLEGVSTPKPLCFIDNLKLKNLDNLWGLFGGTNLKGIIMSKLEGMRGDLVPEKYVERVNRLFEIECNKIEKLGFIPKDFGLFSTMYNIEEDRLYLFDFGQWDIKK